MKLVPPTTRTSLEKVPARVQTIFQAEHSIRLTHLLLLQEMLLRRIQLSLEIIQDSMQLMHQHRTS